MTDLSPNLTQIRPSVNHRFVSRAVESTEKEGLFARLLHLATILTDALEHHVKLVGREAADEDIAALALLAQHTIACGTSQGVLPHGRRHGRTCPRP